MRSYELTLVFKEEIKDVEAQAKALAGSKVNQLKIWGARDLAYLIKGVKRGVYIWMTVELEPDQVAGLDKSLRQNEFVLRHLLISQ